MTASSSDLSLAAHHCGRGVRRSRKPRSHSPQQENRCRQRYSFRWGCWNKTGMGRVWSATFEPSSASWNSGTTKILSIRFTTSKTKLIFPSYRRPSEGVSDISTPRPRRQRRENSAGRRSSNWTRKYPFGLCRRNRRCIRTFPQTTATTATIATGSRTVLELKRTRLYPVHDREC